MQINPRDYIRFEVTGLTTDGKRFKRAYPATVAGGMTALGINLWNGSVWGVLPSGKRVRLSRVTN